MHRLSAEAPVAFPIKIKNKISGGERREKGKRPLFFSFPLPFLPTTQRVLCGGDSKSLYFVTASMELVPSFTAVRQRLSYNFLALPLLAEIGCGSKPGQTLPQTQLLPIHLSCCQEEGPLRWSLGGFFEVSSSADNRKRPASPLV